MLTKAEMEKIWNSNELGVLKRDFCNKRSPMRKFRVSLKKNVTRTQTLNTTHVTVMAKSEKQARVHEEVNKEIRNIMRELHKEFPNDRYGVVVSNVEMVA